MKKAIGILVLGLLLSGNAFADITLYCKQEVRHIFHKGKKETITMKEDWKFVITNNEIKVPGFESLYPKLIRKKDMEGETKFFAEYDSSMHYHSISISRINGNGKIKSDYGKTMGKEENPIKCSNKKPKLLF